MHLEWPCFDQFVKLADQSLIYVRIVGQQANIGLHFGGWSLIFIPRVRYSSSSTHNDECAVSRIPTSRKQGRIETVRSELAGGSCNISGVSFHDGIGSQPSSKGHAIFP